MPAFNVKRSIRIAADQDKVRSVIADFNQWPAWSPWLRMEPGAAVNVRGTQNQLGHGYNWDGQLVGAGDMELSALSDTRLVMDLKFLKPFKSHANVAMQTHEAGPEQTDLSWEMDSSMPFFLFFMVPMMESMIGMDYERGLRMLKEYVETGNVLSTVRVDGVVDLPATRYVGVSDECAMQDIGQSMQNTMPAAGQLVQANNLEVAGPPGALYNEVNIRKQNCRYIAFMPVTTALSIDSGVSGEIAAGKAFKVVHTGRYEHLGNAWSTAMAHIKDKKLKERKGVAGIEWYINDPQETPPGELVTEVYVPLRGI
ncbi:MAG: SRPBCC family protein [Burkholderiaceae bacterium]